MLRRVDFVREAVGCAAPVMLVRLRAARGAFEFARTCVGQNRLQWRPTLWRDSVSSARRWAEDWNAGDLIAAPRMPLDISYCSASAATLMQWCSHVLAATVLLDAELSALPSNPMDGGLMASATEGIDRLAARSHDWQRREPVSHEDTLVAVRELRRDFAMSAGAVGLSLPSTFLNRLQEGE